MQQEKHREGSNERGALRKRGRRRMRVFLAVRCLDEGGGVGRVVVMTMVPSREKQNREVAQMVAGAVHLPLVSLSPS